MTPRPASPSDPTGSATAGRPRSGGWVVAAALVADLLLVTAFVLIGRRSHDSAGGIGGFADTVLPFLAGAAIGWLLCRGWRRPLAVVPTGLTIWVATVIGGLAIRYVRGGGVAVSFAMVTTVVLGVFLLGWRLLARRFDR